VDVVIESEEERERELVSAGATLPAAPSLRE
jgi:hypothetical protein